MPAGPTAGPDARAARAADVAAATLEDMAEVSDVIAATSDGTVGVDVDVEDSDDDDDRGEGLVEGLVEVLCTLLSSLFWAGMVA